ncbi:MAG: hypothetical protein R2747_18350 [Pyrinomonadaceae bacterium]
MEFLDIFNQSLYFYNPKKKDEIFLQIGSCSHWLRPNQTRLTVAGGSAYPAGYDKTINSGYGLPAFDWSELFYFDKRQNIWLRAEGFSGKRKLVCRVTLPNRTRQHNQAAIHLIWFPGSPEDPSQKLKMFYGFRRIDGKWQCVASIEI